MKLRPISDLHFESFDYVPNLDRVSRTLFGKNFIPVMADESEQILLLAGDITTAQYPHIEFYEDLCKRFRHVLEVPSNHFYYGGDFELQDERHEARLKHIKNYTLLQNTFEIIDDVVFYGGAMWTNLNNSNPLDMQNAKNSMMDYRYIRNLTPEDTIHQYNLFVEGLELTRHDFTDHKLVVMSHHGPSYRSVGHRYIGNALNSAFVSHADNVILNVKPIIWKHGHVHGSGRYTIGETEVIHNPRGYGDVSNIITDENPEFDPYLIVDV